MLLIKGFQVGLHRAGQQRFLHALNRALQRQQGVNAGRRIDLPDFQPGRLCSDFPQLIRRDDARLRKLFLLRFPDIGQFRQFSCDL